MKRKNHLHLLLYILFAFIINSCSQNEDIDNAVLNPNADIDNPTSNFFRTNFNGSTFKATTFNATKTAGKFIINGSKGVDGENFSMSVNASAPGFYNSSADVIIYNKSNLTSFKYVSYLVFGTTTTNTVEITITSVDATTKRISGFFDFVGYWSNFNTGATVPPINFTNGSFEMAYSE